MLFETLGERLEVADFLFADGGFDLHQGESNRGRGQNGDYDEHADGFQQGKAGLRGVTRAARAASLAVPWFCRGHRPEATTGGVAAQRMAKAVCQTNLHKEKPESNLMSESRT